VGHLDQRLGRMDLLGLLQRFLCHFVLPRLICPAGHSVLYAKQAPKSIKIESQSKCRVLGDMASKPVSHVATGTALALN
jgi:hypothetical protein